MNLPSTSHRIPSRIVALLLLPLAFAGLPLSAFAQGLPTMEDPSRGQGSGILQTLQNYGYDIVLLIALLVVASMFVGVCYHAYTRYSEIHTGRATWGQFGLTVAVGAILLVVGIWLLTKATGVQDFLVPQRAQPRDPVPLAGDYLRRDRTDDEEPSP